MPDGRTYVHRQSRRHWQAVDGSIIPVGYYEPLRGQRIPFPGPDGSSWTGVLVSIVEAASHVQLTFEDAGPESEHEPIGREERAAGYSLPSPALGPRR
mgnify:CR=1 FL=1